MYRFAIVEDEEGMAHQIKAYIDRYFESDPHASSTVWFRDGMDFISDYTPTFDAVFMDIQMAQMDGMRTAERLRTMDQNIYLVFITQMVQYAVEGYKVDALSYMVKPISYFPFSVVMDKIMERIRHSENEVKLTIGTGNRLRRIGARDVYYIEVKDHYLCFHTKEGKFTEIGKLNDLERKLQDNHFFRCAKGVLVNLAYVTRLDGDNIWVDGDCIAVSKRRHRDFMAALNDYLGERA